MAKQSKQKAAEREQRRRVLLQRKRGKREGLSGGTPRTPPDAGEVGLAWVLIAPYLELEVLWSPEVRGAGIRVLSNEHTLGNQSVNRDR